MSTTDSDRSLSILSPALVPLDELVDEALALHAKWQEQEAAVEAAYRDWCAAPVAERARRHRAYLAAIEQEEAVAMMSAVIRIELDALVRTAA